MNVLRYITSFSVCSEKLAIKTMPSVTKISDSTLNQVKMRRHLLPASSASIPCQNGKWRIFRYLDSDETMIFLHDDLDPFAFKNNTHYRAIQTLYNQGVFIIPDKLGSISLEVGPPGMWKVNGAIFTPYLNRSLILKKIPTLYITADST